MALIPGTNVAARIVPFDTNDTFATHDASYGRDGYRSVADLTERDAITLPRQKIGMLVYVQSEDKIYKITATGEPPTFEELAISGTSVSISGGYGIQVVENSSNNFTISVVGISGGTDSTLRTEVAGITADFENRITVLENNPAPDIYRVEVSNISGYLDTKINSVNLVEGSNITIIESPANTWTISASVSGVGTDHNTLDNLQGGSVGEYYHLTQSQSNDVIGKSEVINISGYLQEQINNISISGSNIFIIGKVEILTNKTTITHPSVDLETTQPFVSLTIPGSGSTIFVEAITNRTSTSFDVILSGTPSTTGYYINYQLANIDNTAISIQNLDERYTLISVTESISASVINLTTIVNDLSATVEGLSGGGTGTSWTPIEGDGIKIEQSGDDYIFSVNPVEPTTVSASGSYSLTVNSSTSVYNVSVTNNSTTINQPSGMSDGQTIIIRIAPNGNTITYSGYLFPYEVAPLNNETSVIIMSVTRIGTRYYATYVVGFTE